MWGPCPCAGTGLRRFGRRHTAADIFKRSAARPGFGGVHTARGATRCTGPCASLEQVVRHGTPAISRPPCSCRFAIRAQQTLQVTQHTSSLLLRVRAPVPAPEAPGRCAPARTAPGWHLLPRFCAAPRQDSNPVHARLRAAGLAHTGPRPYGMHAPGLGQAASSRTYTCPGMYRQLDRQACSVLLHSTLLPCPEARRLEKLGRSQRRPLLAAPEGSGGPAAARAVLSSFCAGVRVLILAVTSLAGVSAHQWEERFEHVRIGAMADMAPRCCLAD